MAMSAERRLAVFRVGIAAMAAAQAALFAVTAQSYAAAAARTPTLYAGLVGILAVAALLEAVVKGRRASRNDDGAGDDGVVARRGVVFLAWIFLYAAAIQPMGYLIATPLFLLGPLLALRPIRPLASCAVALGATGFVWAVFVGVLNLRIPLLPAPGGDLW